MNVYNVALHKVEVNRSQYFSNDYCDEIDAGHVQYTTQQISRDRVSHWRQNLRDEFQLKGCVM